ncbi:hypothetical protein BGZ58_002632 [Dissophora ornata]|nr:hypothetical protein BGZ58_002632 [Dissophora ornata]
MTGKQQGQILYLNGFQKISQARSSGITVVNQPQVLASPAQGRGLGLDHNTGSRTSTPRGPRLNSAATTHTDKRGFTNQPGGGIQTAGGLARAMQERGTGVTNAFLLAPSASVGGEHGHGGPRRRGPGAANGNYINNNNGNSHNHHHHHPHSNTQASRHKAMVLGARPGKKQNGGSPQQGQNGGAGGKFGKAPRRGVAAVAAAAANGPRAQAPKQQQQQQHQQQHPKQQPPKQQAGSKTKGKGPKGKGPKGKPAPANAANLDSELSEYMMKNEQTAASLLDNDLDSYMADKLEDNAW